MTRSKRYYFAGMVAIFLVSIIGFVACEHDPNNSSVGSKYNYEWVFKNRSSYTIQVDISSEYNIVPKSFYIKPGADKSCGTNTQYNEIVFIWYRTDTKDRTGVVFNAGTFYNN